MKTSPMVAGAVLAGLIVVAGQLTARGPNRDLVEPAAPSAVEAGSRVAAGASIGPDVIDGAIKGVLWWSTD